MHTLNTKRISVPDEAGSALGVLHGLPDRATILLHGIARDRGEGELLLATDSTWHVEDHDCTERAQATISPLEDVSLGIPAGFVHFHGFRFLGRESQIDQVATCQRQLGLLAQAVKYNRVHPHELCSTENLEFLFPSSSLSKANALAEYCNIRGWRATVTDLHHAASQTRSASDATAIQGDCHVIHALPGPGLIATLHWQAHQHHVGIIESQSADNNHGAVVVVGLVGSKSARQRFVHEVQRKLATPHRHRHRKLPTMSHGAIWIETHAPHGGNLRITEMLARKSLNFPFLHTSRDGSWDCLQGVLDVGDRRLWNVRRGLEDWCHSQHIDIRTNVLFDDGLGFEHETEAH